KVIRLKAEGLSLTIQHAFCSLANLIFISEKSRQNSSQDAAHATPSPGFPVGDHPYPSCPELAADKGYKYAF
ncbi:MAG TPA: hypothetical protein VII44_06785, partial [Puia sp.]